MEVRQVITVVFCLVLTGTVFSAEKKFGVKCGLAFSDRWGGEEWYENTGIDPYKYQVMKRDFAFGAFLSFELNEYVYFQPELLYCGKGRMNRIEAEDLWRSSNYIVREVTTVSYIEVPLLFKFVAQLNRVHPNFYLGSSFAFKAFVDEYVSTQYGDEEPDVERLSAEAREDLSERIEFMDFVVLGGLGVDVDIGTGALVFDVRFSLGLIPFMKPTDEMKEFGIDKDDFPKHRNRTVIISVGYMFGF